MTHRSWKQVSIFFLGLLLLSLLFFSSSVWACSCWPARFPADALNRYDGVFLGEVISEKPLLDEDQIKRKKLGRSIFVREYEYQFKIEKAWKGVDEETITLTSGILGPACEFGRLKVGQRLLFYAHRKTRWDPLPNSVWSTSRCSRSKLADSAVIETLFLDAAVQKMDPAPIYRQLPRILKSHGNPLYRAAAAHYLRHNMPRPIPPGTIEAVLAGLSDPYPKVRSAVAALILREDLRRHRNIWIKPLISAFDKEVKHFKINPDSKNPGKVLLSLADALVVYGDRDAHLKTIPYYILELKFGDAYEAMLQLNLMGSDAREAIPDLKKLLEDENSGIRKKAKAALKVIQALP